MSQTVSKNCYEDLFIIDSKLCPTIIMKLYALLPVNNVPESIGNSIPLIPNKCLSRILLNV